MGDGSVYYSDPGQTAIIAIILGFLAAYFIVLIGIYIVAAIASYQMYKKANIEAAWLAFIPIANYWPFMWAIKKSAWNILWMIVPIANIVFMIIWMVRLYKAYSMNPLWLLLIIGLVIPGVNIGVGIALLVLHCYMGFSKKAVYNPNFDRPNGSTGVSA